jgi:CDP-glycerol glycerophosphotransferase
VAVPRVSVVVAFYNNADTLADCLKSIAAQTMPDLEVLMVDDGSTDDSAKIAQAQAGADPRFTLIQVPHGGSPGYTRNFGIDRATGEFLAFVDSDDMIPRKCYELLVHTLESTGSDFVSGNVLRIGSEGITQSALHAQAIKGRRLRTHITKTPALLYDVSVWNKLFRKTFWDAHKFRYAEGVVWEDLRLMARAHVLATSVDVIPDHIYYWRHRPQGELSITQSRTDISNLRDRVAALLDIDEFLAAHSTAKLVRQHQRKALVNDLWLYVRDLYKVTEDYQREFIDLANSYLAQVSNRVYRTLPATHKLAYYLIRTRELGKLLEFVTWQLEQKVQTIPVVRRHGRLRADLPWRTDRAARIPDKVYKPYWRDLDPFVQVEGIGWRRGRLVISGCAYVPSVDISKRRYTNKIVILRPHAKFRPPIIVLATSFPHPQATAVSGQERYSYYWAGFRCEISSRWFRIAGHWLTGSWDCFLLVRAHGVWRPARVHSPAIGAAERPEYLQPSPSMRVLPQWVGRHLHVGVVATPARLAGVAVDGTDLILDLELDAPQPAGRGQAAQPGAAQPSAGEVVLVRQGGAATQPFPAILAPAGGGPAAAQRLRATVPGAALAKAGEAPDPVLASENSDDSDGTEWDLYLKVPGRGRLRVAFPATVAEARYPAGDRELAVSRSKYGNVVLAERTPRAVVQEHAWSAEGTLRLAGDYQGPSGQHLEALLRRRDSGDHHALPLSHRDGRFTLDIDAAQMPVFGREVPLRDGIWDISARIVADDGLSGSPVRLEYDHARLAEITHKKVSAGPKLYTFSTAGYDSPIISAEPKLRLSEQGNFNQRVLRRALYPVQYRLPLREAILFISWNGQQCSDNPLGIAEELRRRGDDREHIWVVNDWSVPAPPGATVVLSGTEEYYEAFARCRYVVSNDDMQAHYRKRDGQIYLQTWHGTPLKKIGFDIQRPQFASGTAYFGHLSQDVAKWDLLLSQNPFSTPILRRSFKFDGEICEYGYPRNDALSRGDEAAAERIRRNLGIPDGKRVVMYVPTWRDNQFYASGKYRFDLRLDLEKAWQQLGDDHVILIRGHHHLADDVPAGMRPGFAFNVTDYPDIAELFLVSDVLITDYSSVMFDFASTGRPILLFTYDLEKYRDTLRGFNFDLEAEAPGPLLATSDEVIAAIADIDAVSARYRAAYETFAAKYCPLDDGKAAARVCDRLFGA